MNYLSEFPQLGFGVMRLPYLDDKIDMEKAQAIVDEYMKGDFCYFDMHPSYMGKQAEELVREFVVKRYPRDSYLLADKMPLNIKEFADYGKYFNASQTVCGVSYFDFYLLHAITRDVYERHERLGGFRYMQDLKEQGVVRYIGFSFHDKPELLDEILTKHPEMDFVQLQINYLDWESPVICSKKCYEIARKHSKPIFVMEPIKGGSLANKTDSLQEDEKLGASDLAELALKFVASLPGITVILSGMSEVGHVIDNRKTLLKVGELNERERQLIQNLREKITKVNKIQCTACGYCMEDCPQRIPIPSILALLNACGKNGETLQVYPYQKRIYSGYVFNKGTAGSCIKCGKCENRCPQKLPIREYLAQAASLFEKSPTEVKLQRATYKYRTLRDWMKVLQSGNSLEPYFKYKGFGVMAVYGIGEIGELLIQEIKNYKTVRIEYGIDKKAKILVKDIPLVEPDDVLQEVDVVVVTPTFDFENIERQLRSKINCPIVSLDEIIKWCL
ncbi:MAG: aldo/keto reductase [Lachnospiraceae bacterium]|nr:aldo/keto reductase [Lachnospiraceae bacterium]